MCTIYTLYIRYYTSTNDRHLIYITIYVYTNIPIYTIHIPYTKRIYKNENKGIYLNIIYTNNIL